MNVDQINACLARGEIDRPGVFPHLEALSARTFVFDLDIGLPVLPKEPGFLSLRGPRQYGKSTWLEDRMKETVREFGPGTAFYLNGDEFKTSEDLLMAMRAVLPGYRKGSAVRRLFVDEITSVPEWEKAVKRLVDSGEMRGVLTVSTGSKAADLRRGTERLPGRKGRLARTEYLFVPVSFREFSRVCGDVLGSGLLPAYLISGGSPVACGELASTGVIPEYVIEMTRDWIRGEAAACRREREPLLSVFEVIERHGGTPLGQTKLGREAGLANNTVAAGYVELLADLLCVAPALAWDESRRIPVRRRPYKLHFVNLLAAVAWSPRRLRRADDFQTALTEAEQGKWLEWLAAQELFRRRAIEGRVLDTPLLYWATPQHELDFVLGSGEFLEIKRGAREFREFAWFTRLFPRGRLTVINENVFETDRIRGVPFEKWLFENTGTQY